MLKRVDHIGVLVDNLDDAKRFLSAMGMHHHHDLDLGRLKAAFYTCGDIEVEVVDISEPVERRRRLGENKARIEHIAIEVDDLNATVKLLQEIGVRTQTAEPLQIASNLNYFTDPESCDGVVYQLIQRNSSDAS